MKVVIEYPELPAKHNVALYLDNCFCRRIVLVLENMSDLSLDNRFYVWVKGKSSEYETVAINKTYAEAVSIAKQNI